MLRKILKNLLNKKRVQLDKNAEGTIDTSQVTIGTSNRFSQITFFQLFFQPNLLFFFSKIRLCHYVSADFLRNLDLFFKPFSPFVNRGIHPIVKKLLIPLVFFLEIVKALQRSVLSQLDLIVDFFKLFSLISETLLEIEETKISCFYKRVPFVLILHPGILF